MTAARTERPVRVLALVPDFGPSAPAVVASHLAARLPPDRFSFAAGVLDRRAAGRLPGGVAAISFHLRYPLDVLGWWTRRATLRDYAPDVIHAFGPAAARLTRLAVIPGVGPRARPRVVVSHANRSAGGPDRWLTRQSLKVADRVIAATQAEASPLTGLGIAADRVIVIPPGVPPAPPSPDPIAFRRALGIPDAARLVIAAGRFDAAAGLRTAVWAFDVVRYVAPDLYLVLVGAGPERDRLERFGRAIGFDDYRIRFAGARPDLPALMRLAEVVWVTHEHGGVHTALEAMAAGRPVVAMHTPELAEITTDGAAGRLVPVGDRVRLAAVTHELLERPDAAVRLGDAARVAAARFPVEGMVARFAQVYDELIRSNLAETPGVQ